MTFVDREPQKRINYANLLFVKSTGVQATVYYRKNTKRKELRLSFASEATVNDFEGHTHS